jgi:hypothetical protein
MRVLVCVAGVLIASIAVSQPVPEGGAIGVDPDNPHYFRAADGKPVLLVGDYVWGTFSDVDYDYEAMLGTLQANGLNFARVWVWWGLETFPEPDRRTNAIPFLRPGPGMARDGRPRYDLTRPNEAFFERLHSVCEAARERGIFLQLTLFDAWMLKHADLWALHAYHRDNNVNGVDGDPADTGRGTDGERGFCSLGNPTAFEQQKAFIRHVVDSVSDLDNVFFEIANENYYSADWERALCEFIHEYEAGKPKRHLSMPLDLPDHDYGGIKTWDLASLHANLLRARALGQPLIFDTDGIGSPDDATVRKAAWTAFASGGHVSYLDESLQAGPAHGGDVRGTSRATLRGQLGHLARFARRVRFWEMHPEETAVKAGAAYALGSADELVAYLPTGGTLTLDSPGMKGPLTALWLNPRTGEMGAASACANLRQREFAAPDAQDWVLWVCRGTQAAT